MTDNNPENQATILALTQKLSEANENISIFGAKGSFKAFIIAELIRTTQKQFLIVAPKHKDAERIYNDINFFLSLGDSPVKDAKEASTQSTRLFPCLDTLPYDRVVPQIEVTAHRMRVLSTLLAEDIRCVVTSSKAALRKVIPKDVLTEEQELLMYGEEIEREKFLNRLVSWGYTRVGIVEDPGDFAVRGHIIDIYIPSYDGPARIELFGDLVESIRIFDPLTQRSVTELEEIVCFPVVDVIYNSGNKKRAQSAITELCSDFDIAFSKRKEFVEKIKEEVYFSNLFEFVPAFYEKMDTLFDYLDGDVCVINLDPTTIKSEIEEYSNDIYARYKKRIGEKTICLPPEMIYLSENELNARQQQHQNIDIRTLELVGEDDTNRFRFSVQLNDRLRKRLVDFSGNKKDIFKEHVLTDESREDIEGKMNESGGALQPLVDILSTALDSGHNVIIAARTLGQAERLCELIDGYDVPYELIERVGQVSSRSKIKILKGDLSHGFICDSAAMTVIIEEEIFGARVKRSVKKRAKLDHFLSSLSDLKADDFIVHVDNGVGLYKGLKAIEIEGIHKDFLIIEFAGADILYLPVDRLNLVMKYSGVDASTPKLDKLGGVAWVKLKSKIRKSIEIMAGELLKIDAKRTLHEGYVYSKSDHYYSEFEASFEFEETPDQMNAIEDVIADMEKKKPMDRLICGDVGFGKTEVAIRAAFKAVMDGKQVAILVPTTVLAQQHYKTFRDRFKGYPFTIEMLSRFRTAAEAKVIKKDLKDGKVNIIIGTHALLAKGTDFLDLGLVVIDEEQRFGVRHKEKLKELKSTVDVITLSATPIPRTLHMSLSGIRDISVINTPPLDRLSIRTIVSNFDDDLIKDAITRELKREGQVFFVHNRVQTIFDIAAYLQKLIPNAKIGVAHGQMPEKALEKRMLGFVNREFDILVSTTIIESGLDISAANTIIIDRADTFGLAQLYQLRGRVGRGKVRAYAYLLIPLERDITKDAVKRLNALIELSELGSGYKIAMYDLEIRGAGNLLGKDQSGSIIAVGFDLYTQLLEQVVSEMKGIKVDIQIEPEININVQAYIPEGYIDEINQRLVLYQRVSSVRSVSDFDDLKDELVDRYGRFPDEVQNLFETMKLRFLMKKLLIASVDIVKGEVVLSFDPRTRFELRELMSLVKSKPRKYRFSAEWKFAISIDREENIEIIQNLKDMLARFYPKRSPKSTD